MGIQLTGFIVWITGPPAAGKTTLATLLCRSPKMRGPVQLLDGDELRTWLSDDLGFSATDRTVNARRVGHLARMLAGHGVGVFVALISPKGADRSEQRNLAEKQGLTFIEVYVETSLHVRKARDPKGNYEKAITGALENFTGVSSAYEVPTSPDVIVRTDNMSPAQCADLVLQVLSRGPLARGQVLPAVDEQASSHS